MAKQTYTTGQVLTAAQMTALQANDYNWTVSAKTASYVLVAADAGTRITMSNAGATTITVNTALFTAGDTLTITNIGAGACTITAGTATVSTAGSLVLNQYDSGTLYFSSTSAAIWNGANPGDITGVTAGTGISGGGTSGTVTVTNSMATEITAAGDIIVGTGSGTFDNLPIGTTAQVLTADTTVSPYKVKWATPATPASGMTFIKTATFSSSSSSSTTFDSVISSTYNDYIVICHDISLSSADTFLLFQYRKAAATKSAAQYSTTFFGYSLGNAPNSTQYWNDAGATSHQILKGGPGADGYGSTIMTIYNQSYPRFTGHSINGYRSWEMHGGGLNGMNDTIDGFILTPSTGTFSGTVTIYGLAKS